jgi:hypothetical protein
LIEPTSFDIVVSSIINVGAKSSAAVVAAEGRGVNRVLTAGLVLGVSMSVAAGAILAMLVIVYRRNEALAKRDQTEETGVELGVLGALGEGEQVLHVP